MRLYRSMESNTDSSQNNILLSVDVYEPEDHREKLRELAKQETILADPTRGGIKSRVPIDFAIESLPLDYRIIPHDISMTTLVERKSVSDFFSSFGSGRLPEQLRKAMDKSPITILAIEGAFNVDDLGYVITYPQKWATKWKFASMMNFLLEIQSYGISVAWIPSHRCFPEYIIDLCRFLSKAEHTGFKPRRKRFPLSRDEDSMIELRLDLYSSFPSVDEKRAKALLEAYDTPRKLCNATAKDIRYIKGFGKTIATKIDEILGSPNQNV
jgi:ERCC4-type nuclease